MKFSTFYPALAATAASAISTFDAGSGMSYAISIPQATMQSGSGDFFFQMVSPTSMSWVAMGIGEGMNGNSIFVMYADGNGNVTVSPRLGVGFVQPVPNPAAQVTLLEGSGVVGDNMVANVRCSNCSTWDGGSFDFTSQTFVHANRQGAALDSTDTDANIVRHQRNGQEFTFDLAQATSTTDSDNPFATVVGGIAGGSGSGSGSGSDTSGSGSSTSSSSSQGDFDADKFDMYTMSHGIIMGLTVVILLPLGAILMRVTPCPWWLHGALQLVFLVLFTAGWALGYVAAGMIDIRFTGEGSTHTILGTVVFAFLLVQPLGGYAAHLLYKKHQRRSIPSHAHVWLGRATLILAIINGGLGLQLSANTTGGIIAYSVVAGIVGVVYIAAAAFGEWRRSKKATAVRGVNGNQDGKEVYT